jgi:hypothetical protein
MFASLPVCRGNLLSPRDDIESLLYILVFLETNHELPWKRFQKAYGNCTISLKELRGLRSTESISDEVVPLFPTEKLKVYYKDLLKLKFEDTPDYKRLHSCLADAFNKAVKKTALDQSMSSDSSL